MKTIEKPKVELKIKRVNGEIETILTDKFGEMDERKFDLIKKETAKAGRGEVLEYTNIPGVYEKEKTDIELEEYCNHRDRMEEAMGY